jgi:hypothetical protein
VDIFFPFRQSPADLEHVFREKKRHINSRFFALIRESRPYPSSDGISGDDRFYLLHEHSRSSKHRAGLRVQVGVARMHMPTLGTMAIDAAVRPTLVPRFNPDTGDWTVFRTDPSHVFFGEPQIEYGVALGDSTVDHPTSATNFLRYNADTVGRVIDAFELECARS